MNKKDLLKKLKEIQEQLNKLEEEDINSELESLLQEGLKQEMENSFHFFIEIAWSIVDSSEFINGFYIEAIAEHLEALYKGEIKNLLINIPPRHGKLLSHDTDVLTTKGWKKHGELEVGDYVFNPEGIPVKIIRTSLESVANTKVTFNNCKEEIYCNEDHLWEVYDRTSKIEKVVDTKYLLGRALVSNSGGKQRSNIQINNIKPINFPSNNKELILHPYFLGCWLGDGSSSKPCITCEDKDVTYIKELEKRSGIYSNVNHSHTINKHVKSYYFSHQDITKKLKELNVYKNKHIPSAYKQSSIDNRLQLLAGLIDTDGHVDKNGRVRIVSGFKDLALDIYELCSQLGLRPYTQEVSPEIANKYKKVTDRILSKKTYYVIGFQSTEHLEIPTVLERKKIKRKVKQRRLGIKSVERVEDIKRGKCITIDDSRGVYLVTKSLIPTHNSNLCSVLFPVWVWLKDPSLDLLWASYNANLAIRDSTKSRRLIQSQWFKDKWNLTLADDDNQKARYVNSSGGARVATSVGGSGTGFGYDICGIDDPHKATDVGSKSKMEAVLEWYSGTISTRANNPNTARQVVIMQRLAENDLSSYLIDLGTFEHLKLPMEYVPTTTVTKIGWKDPRVKKGQLLSPDRYKIQEVDELKIKMGAWKASGQLQQEPIPLEGNLINRNQIKYFKSYLLPMNLVDFIVSSWDLATGVTDGDYTVGQVWCFYEGSYYLIDSFRDKVDFIKQLEVIESFNNKWKINYNLIEKQASAKAIYDLLKFKYSNIELLDTRNYGGNKESRFLSISPLFHKQKIYLPEDKKFTIEFEEELLKFPRGKHDDQVDAAVYALSFLQTKNEKRIINYHPDIVERILVTGKDHLTEEELFKYDKYLEKQREQEKEARTMTNFFKSELEYGFNPRDLW